MFLSKGHPEEAKEVIIGQARVVDDAAEVA
jgi:hypothetical protein